ncbi:hypothetical protein GOEFS_008_00350 [Gordonia effusa NBRC 100432]|uniref:Integral membrane protein n=1 Tax=Gordonia effusa NBRC 100432 TaxID=1077974 RepID=H0QUX5_9ACTN|nr:hypothetical protein GOEFS_008_00350 [Gordonia effusa NBRC 100432]
MVALEGFLGVGAAIVLVILGLLDESGRIASSHSYGTAAWFAIIGGGVLCGGLALLTGRRWGRAIAVVAQILLVPVAFALLTGSEHDYGAYRVWYSVPLIIAAVTVLVLLFMPSSVRWLAQDFGEDEDGGNVTGA